MKHRHSQSERKVYVAYKLLYSNSVVVLSKRSLTCILDLFVVGECVNVGGFQDTHDKCVLTHLCLYLPGMHLAFGSQLGGFEAHVCIPLCAGARVCLCTDM